ncbi:uncharacterized protein LOC124483905 isoform X2 [Hypomesus transpacificus]|uniref:uncharacterized protein LOC124483905 isoform X2 n=1 Tax=Hypomesus transpacificus TaxID=137520 RepID=UPI001F07B6DF|nr:uncharacterized protein LOC124483905 isoform X2 [Hypomesus transpacificus]
MAETVRSLFDYREPPTLDSDGEGSKPAPPQRGRGCGRKRKGTPVKVFVTDNVEENVPEHSYGPGDRKEAAENKRPTLDGPFYTTDPAHNCGSSEQGEEGGAGVARGGAGGSVYPPPPNCRIREVHCGSQVRLVVIAIRDITKGEEITVDYSLTEWGDNTMGFRGPVSPGRYECNSDPENDNIKKDYLTPSWSLSPSSSPVSHSDASDSDPENEAGEEGAPRGPRHPALQETPHSLQEKDTTPDAPGSRAWTPAGSPAPALLPPSTLPPPPPAPDLSSRPRLR